MRAPDFVHVRLRSNFTLFVKCDNPFDRSFAELTVLRCFVIHDRPSLRSACHSGLFLPGSHCHCLFPALKPCYMLSTSLGSHPLSGLPHRISFLSPPLQHSSFFFLFFVIFPPCSRPTRVITARARPRPRLQTGGLLAGRLVLLRPAVSLASSAGFNRFPSFSPPPRNPKTPWYVKRVKLARPFWRAHTSLGGRAAVVATSATRCSRSPTTTRGTIGVCPRLRAH